MKDNYLDILIGEKLKAQDEQERSNRTPSGKLSASMLGWPLQWQILKSFGVPQPQKDEYVLRKFQRGKDVENRLVEWMDDMVKETQSFVEYRDTIGYIDAIVDADKWEAYAGYIPFEIKSVSNMKFKRIEKQGPDRSHNLQAGFYALARGCENYGICYISTDDYRIETHILETKDIALEINRIITRYEDQRKTGKVPVFQAEEKWQDTAEYSSFPEWSKLTQEEIDEKITKYINK